MNEYILPGVDWIVGLQECGKVVHQSKKRHLRALITLIQTLRKQKIEKEMMSLFKLLTECITEMVNRETLKSMPGLVSDPEGIPFILNPWKGASKKTDNLS